VEAPEVEVVFTGVLTGVFTGVVLEEGFTFEAEVDELVDTGGLTVEAGLFAALCC
jgi:hypothetical protein